MKNAGIVADNYKLEKFKKELTKNGFTDFIIEPFMEGVSIIKVNIPDDKIIAVKKICQRVELHFKRAN